MPAPYLVETTRQTKVFSVGELEVIARHLARHEDSFSYLVEHSPLTEMLHQAIHAYRAEFI